YRDAPLYFWNQRHDEIMNYNLQNKPDLVLIGNSITHFWGGMPAGPHATGADSWKKNFEPRSVVNLGMGWDRIENVLWRVYRGELDGFSAKQIVLMIGTNNLGINTDEEIADGIRFLLTTIQERQPEAKV